MYEDEIWKDVVGYEGKYQVSNYGRLISFYGKNGKLTDGVRKFLKGKIDKDGYIEYGISNNGKLKYRRGHRLVAEAFIPNPENKPQINHIDGIKDNNHISNLEWVTVSENGIHKYKNGLGENSRDMASYTHGKRCKLIEIKESKEYVFNSLTKASEFLGKHPHWLADTIKRRNDYKEYIINLGYYIEVEEKRTYERIAEES